MTIYKKPKTHFRSAQNYCITLANIYERYLLPRKIYFNIPLKRRSIT